MVASTIPIPPKRESVPYTREKQNGVGGGDQIKNAKVVVHISIKITLCIQTLAKLGGKKREDGGKHFRGGASGA